MKVEGVELDLVNLRSETYTDTRIPVMAFGTAQQDAERRDFTINSLFYNIGTSQVEDWTGRGLDDLRKGVIRTPLLAAQTFQDGVLILDSLIRVGLKLAISGVQLVYWLPVISSCRASYYQCVSR